MKLNLKKNPGDRYISVAQIAASTFNFLVDQGRKAILPVIIFIISSSISLYILVLSHATRIESLEVKAKTLEEITVKKEVYNVELPLMREDIKEIKKDVNTIEGDVKIILGRVGGKQQ